MRYAKAVSAGMPLLLGGVLLGSALWTGTALADQVTVSITLVTPGGIGPAIGTIQLADTKDGLRLTPLLRSLGPGPHRLEIYENGDCGPGEFGGKKIAAGAAGAPLKGDKSGGPENSKDKGHLVDLPPLMVNKDSIARAPVTAQGIKLVQVKGRAIVIHASEENLPARPESSGGNRLACGVIR